MTRLSGHTVASRLEASASLLTNNVMLSCADWRQTTFLSELIGFPLLLTIPRLLHTHV